MRFWRRVSVMFVVCVAGVFGQNSAPVLPENVTDVFERAVSGPERATLALAQKMRKIAMILFLSRANSKAFVHLLNWPNILQ